MYSIPYRELQLFHKSCKRRNGSSNSNNAYSVRIGMNGSEQSIKKYCNQQDSLFEPKEVPQAQFCPIVSDEFILRIQNSGKKVVRKEKEKDNG